jgi:hypothetical protein
MLMGCIKSAERDVEAGFDGIKTNLSFSLRVKQVVPHGRLVLENYKLINKLKHLYYSLSSSA